jgi:tetratricopeptide (TPR) repeat protein
LNIRRLLGLNDPRAPIVAEAQRLLQDGQGLAAGKLLEDNGLLAEAADCYLEGGEYRAAADVLARLGRRDEALDAARRGAQRAAREPSARVSALVKEAEALFQRGNSLDAAKLFAQAGQWARAGDLYARAGYALRAAEAFERAREPRRAAEWYERHLAEHLAGGVRPEGRERQAALKAGQLFAQLGQPDKALHLLARGGHTVAAADLALSLERFAEAAELYHRAEQFAQAADAWERGGERVRAALLRGELALRAERPGEAAASFLEGHDFYRAAELYEGLGRPADAADAYAAGGAWGEAGQAFLQAGAKERAAEAFERGRQFARAAELREELGDLGRASSLFEQAEDPFRAGRAAALAGDARRAIAWLQRVEPGEAGYDEAAERLAELFVAAGMPRLAVERAQLALGGRAPTNADVGLHYWLAAAHEALGDASAAAEIYQRILAVDFTYRDAAERVRRLRTPAAPAPPAREAPPVAPPAAPPPPAVAAPPASPSAAAAGDTPRFALRELIGRGMLGEVHRAEERDGRAVALRVLRPAGVSDLVLRGLLGDLAAAQRVSHPNLVKVIALEDHDGRPCVASELVRGTNMAAFLVSRERLGVKRCHALGRALALALSYVHGHKLVHGALRPSSVFVVSGIVKLADLGLGPLHRLAVPAGVYRAPEDRLDVAGDVYALGATLYHLMTGREPPRSAALPVLPPRPSDLAPGIPQSFDRLLLRALDPRPEARFQSAKEMVQALDAMVTIN